MTVKEHTEKIRLIAQSNSNQLTINSLICLNIYRISKIVYDTKEEQSEYYTKLVQKYTDKGYIKPIEK